MAKRKAARKAQFNKKEDLRSWNFILFLVLAFILLVVVLGAVTQLSNDVRSKAGLICPQVTLPRAEDCPGGWTYERDATNGCPTFVCKAR